MELRTSTIIAAEIARKRARRESLQFRQGEVASELEKLRTAAARALADGSTTGSADASLALEREQVSTARAIDMLNADLETLEREHADAENGNATAAKDRAITAATAALNDLEATFVAVAQDTLLPKTDALLSALRDARQATNVADQARRKAGDNSGSAPDPTSSIMRRRTELLTIAGTIRSYLDDRNKVRS